MAEGPGIAVTIAGTRGQGAQSLALPVLQVLGNSHGQQGRGLGAQGRREGDVCSLDCSQKGTLQPEVKQNCLKA